MLEANYLSILLTPTYERPIDTPQDILDRGLEVIYPPGSLSLLDGMKNSPAKIDRDLAEITIFPKVIFRSVEIILIFIFPKRIGLNLGNG